MNRKERKNFMKPYESYMIISDLDGTIIPHGGCVSEANKRGRRPLRHRDGPHAGSGGGLSRRRGHHGTECLLQRFDALRLAAQARPCDEAFDSTGGT